MEVTKDNHLFWLDCCLMTFYIWGKKQCSSDTSHPNHHFIGNQENGGPEGLSDLLSTAERTSFQVSWHPGHFEGQAWPNSASNLSTLPREERLAFVLLWQWSAFEIFFFFQSLPPACATRGSKATELLFVVIQSPLDRPCHGLYKFLIDCVELSYWAEN